jgi:hypothetical protein
MKATRLRLTGLTTTQQNKCVRAGLFWSTLLQKYKLVDGASHPLSGRIQLKKWNEQSWQLCIHMMGALSTSDIVDSIAGRGVLHCSFTIVLLLGAQVRSQKAIF